MMLAAAATVESNMLTGLMTQPPTARPQQRSENRPGASRAACPSEKRSRESAAERIRLA